jgi:teichuronic acid biosynthesis glycosyltransferase TuaC
LLDVGIITNKASGFGRYCFPQKFFEMLSCGTPMVVAATGEVRDLMKACKQALFRPEIVSDLSMAILSQLESPCIPVVDIPSWDKQGTLLSSYLEKICRG